MPGLDFLGEYAKLFSSQELSREMEEFLKHLPDDITSPEELQKYLIVLDGLEVESRRFGREKRIVYKKE